MQIKDLKARLDQAQITNKQMQDYVNFLKNSYISYFNENTLNTFENSSNLIGSQNNLFSIIRLHPIMNIETFFFLIGCIKCAYFCRRKAGKP